VVVQKGGDYVELTPSRLLSLELEVTQKKDRQKMSLELSWRTTGVQTQAAPLSFGSSLPPSPNEGLQTGEVMPDEEQAGEPGPAQEAALACPPISCCGVGQPSGPVEPPTPDPLALDRAEAAQEGPALPEEPGDDEPDPEPQPAPKPAGGARGKVGRAPRKQP
jgi:hypothetical protein